MGKLGDKLEKPAFGCIGITSSKLTTVFTMLDLLLANVPIRQNGKGIYCWLETKANL